MPPPQHTGDIAIIGMSCRVAGAESPSELWDLLAASKDVRKEIDRFNSAGYYSARGAKRKGLTNVRHAYLMDRELDRFDNAFFSIPASEAIAMDPQQRLLLELSYEAIENAGIPLEYFQGTDTAVYCGKHVTSSPLSHHRSLSLLEPYGYRSYAVTVTLAGILRVDTNKFVNMSQTVHAESSQCCVAAPLLSP